MSTDNKSPAKATKATPTKAPAVAAKPKAVPTHPPYLDMVAEAIKALKERSGSSVYAIHKYIEEHHPTVGARVS